MKASKCKLDVRAGAVMWATLCIFLGQQFFYQGKTITVISGREPGGLGDLRHRAILPYLKKHIPGQPNIVTEYMPGGGGRKRKQGRPPKLTAQGLGEFAVGHWLRRDRVNRPLESRILQSQLDNPEDVLEGDPAHVLPAAADDATEA